MADVAVHPPEETNLAVSRPEKTQELTALYDAWLDEMSDPNAGAGKRWSAEANKDVGRQKRKRDAIRAERQRERKNKANSSRSQ